MDGAKPSALNVANAGRLSRLAAAFSAFRRSSPGQPFPAGLCAQVAALLEAGVSVSAIQGECHLSWTQVNRWRSRQRGAASKSAGAIASPTPPKVLSVVEADARASLTAQDDVEIRIGQWRLSLSRAVG
jgi:hypothetical protein